MTINQLPIKVRELIEWLDDCIFPQGINDAVKKFDEDTIIDALNKNLIQESKSKIGSTPTTMQVRKGFMELSEFASLVLLTKKDKTLTP